MLPDAPANRSASTAFPTSGRPTGATLESQTGDRSGKEARRRGGGAHPSRGNTHLEARTDVSAGDGDPKDSEHRSRPATRFTGSSGSDPASPCFGTAAVRIVGVAPAAPTARPSNPRPPTPFGVTVSGPLHLRPRACVPTPVVPCGHRGDTRDDVVPVWLSHRPPWRSRGNRRARTPEGTHTVQRPHAPSRTITSARHGMIGSVSPTLVTLAPSLPMSPVLPSTALAADTSLGVVQRSAPPSSRSRGSPLQVSAGCPASTFGREVPTSRLVPPSWFHTTSAAFSSRAARTCCSPLPTLGFIPFPTALPPSFPGGAPALRSLPSSCSDLERVQVLGPVTRDAIADVPVHLLPCPPAVSVHTGAVLSDSLQLRGATWEVSFPSSPGRPTSGPCSTRGSVADHAVARALDPLLPWARASSFPLRPPSPKRR